LFLDAPFNGQVVALDVFGDPAQRPPSVVAKWLENQPGGGGRRGRDGYLHAQFEGRAAVGVPSVDLRRRADHDLGAQLVGLEADESEREVGDDPVARLKMREEHEHALAVLELRRSRKDLCAVLKNAAGDVHGVDWRTIPNIKEVFGETFRSAVVIREPITRLRSQMALFDAFKAFRSWDLYDMDALVERLHIDLPADDYATKLFVHGARMLNAIHEEVHVGPVYRAEDLTTDADTLMQLAHHLSAGKAREMPAWARQAIEVTKTNSHVSRRGPTDLQDWQIAVIKKCVPKETWDLYEHFGYETPAFVLEHV